MLDFIFPLQVKDRVLQKESSSIAQRKQQNKFELGLGNSNRMDGDSASPRRMTSSIGHTFFEIHPRYPKAADIYRTPTKFLGSVGSLVKVASYPLSD